MEVYSTLIWKIIGALAVLFIAQKVSNHLFFFRLIPQLISWFNPGTPVANQNSIPRSPPNSPVSFGVFVHIHFSYFI